MESILTKLISFKSVSANSAVSSEALDYVERYLEERGMYTCRYTVNGYSSLVATVKPSYKTPAVLLSAHIDVVPGYDQSFILRKEGDKLIGRGVYDMKFAIAAYMRLVDTLKTRLDQYDFGIMITSDEEIGGDHGVRHLIAEGYRPKVVIVPDGGDNWHIQEFTKGVQWVKLDAKGIPGHASRPWEGENAIHTLLAAIADIQKLFPPQPSREDTLMSVGTIAGGTTTNQIADHATATLDIRYGSMADYEELYPRIRTICHKYNIGTELLIDDAPCINDPRDLYIKQFHDIMVDTIGYDPGQSFAYAVTDARYFNAIGIPAIVVEPIGGAAHRNDEWISASSCEDFLTILLDYFEAVARTTIPRANTANAAVTMPIVTA